MNHIKQLNYQELQQWQAEKRDFQLIDVREVEEHDAYNIGGELLPMSVLFRYTDRLDTSKPIVLYCKRGIRSQLAIQRLAPRFPEADFYNLQGGILNLFFA